TMLVWGQDGHRGFRLQQRPESRSEAGVEHLQVGYRVSGLSAARGVLGFVKSNGNAFVMRTAEKKLTAVSCGAEDQVLLLSDRGALLSVDPARFPLTARHQDKCSGGSSTDGQVYTWGQNSRGQLGLGKISSGSGSPQHVRSLAEIPLVQVAAGGDQSFSLTVSGGLICWGRNDHGQLGLGDTAGRLTYSSKLEQTVWFVPQHGSVFTFGSGQFGQLGHNSTRDELRPRLVAELWGAKVTKVACGRRHSLVLTDTRRLYSFGCGDQGQLGRGEDPTVPLPVQLPTGSRARFCRKALTNEDAANKRGFYSWFQTPAASKSKTSSLQKTARLQRVHLIRYRHSYMQHRPEISRTFSSACCLNNSFLEQRRDKHFQTSLKYSGLNLKLARRAFKNGLTSKKTVSVEALRIYLLLIELLHVIQKHTRHRSTKLAEAVATAVAGLSAESLQVIGNVATKHQLQAVSVSPDSTQISPLVVGNFPIVMDLQSKKLVFDWNANYSKVAEASLRLYRNPVLHNTINCVKFVFQTVDIPDALFELFWSLGCPTDGYYEYCELVLRRASVLEDTFKELAAAAPEDQRFYLFGVLCGLALYNQHIIYLPFPLVLFKKLLGVKPSLEDMIEPSRFLLQPSDRPLTHCALCLKEAADDVWTSLFFYCVFLLSRREFVEAYVNHAFNTSVEPAFQAFRRGFFQVCERDLVKLFRPKELQEVMVGKHFQDWKKLKQNTRYEGEFHANYPTVQMFWEVFEELSENQKKAFLWFVTGFEQVPILGKDKITMIIRQRYVQNLDHDRYYPETHTCSSVLELPLYSTKEIMQSRLTEALSNNRRIRQ
uniref:HECT domain-containing protein n=1 Tax=Stegastes partitus TaxID=144197 RepID=A0A3B5ASG4_9TELE